MSTSHLRGLGPPRALFADFLRGEQRIAIITALGI